MSGDYAGQSERRLYRIFTPPAATEKVARDCISLAAKGLRHFGMQPGAGSPEAERVAKEAGLIVTSGRCILQELSRY